MEGYKSAKITKKTGVLFTHVTEVEENNEIETEETNSKKKKKSVIEKKKREQDEKSVSAIFVKSTSLHKSKKDLEQVYKIGTVCERIRIVGYQLVEGIPLGSNLPSIINAEVTHQSQVNN